MIAYMQWYNENEYRAYPLKENATRTDVNNNILDNSIIVDLSITAPIIYSNIFISSLNIHKSFISISIGSASTGLLLGTFNRDYVRPYAAYPLIPVVQDVAGYIVFGSGINKYFTHHRFIDSSSSGLESKVIHTIDKLPIPKIMGTIGYRNLSVSGVVKLIEGAGVKIEKASDNTIVIKLLPDIKYEMSSACQTSATRRKCGTAPITNISGAKPTSDGKIVLRFS